MNKIRLTESELHNLIKDAVTQIINENEMYNLNEGPLDFFKSLGRQGKNRATQAANVQKERMNNYVNDKKQQVSNWANRQADKIGNYVNDKKEQVGNWAADQKEKMSTGYNNLKQGINQGIQNARQDSAMADMRKAYNNFAQAVDRYSQSNGEVGKVLKGAMTKINNILSRYENHQ